MDGLSISKEALLATMLEARTSLTESANKVFGETPIKGAFMCAIDGYEKYLKEFLGLGVQDDYRS